MSETTVSTSSWQAAMSASGDRRGVRGKPDGSDILFFLVLAAATAWALFRFPDSMDIYEKVILALAVPGVAWMANAVRADGSRRVVFVLGAAGGNARIFVSEPASLALPERQAHGFV